MGILYSEIGFYLTFKLTYSYLISLSIDTQCSALHAVLSANVVVYVHECILKGGQDRIGGNEVQCLFFIYLSNLNTNELDKQEI